MESFDRNLSTDRTRALARLAALQRIKEQAARANRKAMLQTLEQLIEAEARELRELSSQSQEKA